MGVTEKAEKTGRCGGGEGYLNANCGWIISLRHCHGGGDFRGNEVKVMRNKEK